MATVRGMTPEAIRALLKKEIGDYQALSIAVNSAKGASESAIAEVGKIRNDLENMNFDFEFDDSKLNAAMEQFDKDMEALNNSLDEVKTEALAREDKLTALERALNQDRTKFNKEMQDMARELAESKTDLDKQLAKASEDLAANVNDVGTRLSGELEKANKTVKEDLAKDLSNLDTKLQKVFSEAINSVGGDLYSKTDDLDKALKDYKSKTDSKVSNLLSELDKAKAFSDGFLQPGNLVWNPMALDDARGISRENANVTIESSPSGGKEGAGALKITHTGTGSSYVYYGKDQGSVFEVRPGDVVAVSVWFKSTVDIPYRALKLHFAWGDRQVFASSTTPANTWVHLSGDIPYTQKAPKTVWFSVVIGDDFPVNGSVIISNPHAQRKTTSDLIVDGAVVAGKIATDAVEAKNIVSGAVTAGKIATDAVEARNIVSGAVTAGKIASDAVTANNIAAGSIGAKHILADSIGAKHIVGKSIGADQLAANSVTSDKIVSNAVDADKIKAKSIGTDHLVANAVTTEKLASKAVKADNIDANAVTSQKIASKAINGDHIQANSIDASKMTIVPGNLFPDPHFQDPTWGTSGTSYAHKNNGGEFRMFPNGKQVGTYYTPDGIGDGALMLEPGASYRITMNVYGSSQFPDDAQFIVYLRYRNSSGRYIPSQRVAIPATRGVSVESAIFTAPDNASSSLYTIGFFAFFDGNGGTLSIWDVQLTRAADASLIVKGGVQADHIASGAITTDHMSANSIDGDRIKSNTLDAEKIRAKSLTSDHVTFKDGFIDNAMIGNAQITSSKIKELDAGKIKTGTLDADRIGSNSIDASKIKADSITVKELRAGTVVPLGASLIHSEPKTSGDVPEPIWWEAFDYELSNKVRGWDRPLEHPWRTNKSSRGGNNIQTFIPKRLMKIQPGKKYRVRFWARANDADSRLFMALKSQDGSDAVASGRVESGSYVEERFGEYDGWKGYRQDHSKNPKGGFLLWNFVVPTSPTMIETLITFKPDVEYVYLEEVTFNHGWGKGTSNQYIAGLVIDLDVVSQEEVDAVQTKQIDDNKARINEIEALQKKQAKDNDARISEIQETQKKQSDDNKARIQEIKDAQTKQNRDNSARMKEIEAAQKRAQWAIDMEEKYRMGFGSGWNNTTYFSPGPNEFVEVATYSSGISLTNNSTVARLKKKCRGYIALIQNTESGAMDMMAWNVDGDRHDLFKVEGGLNQVVRKWLIMYQLYE